MIKRILQIGFLGSLLLFSGCGSGDVTGDSENTIQVSKDETYTLSSGDTIRENDENTTIQITHTIETGVKTVEVLSGSITIIKGNY
ncbi:MAG: hypothetical protein PHF17_06255 [Arcobacteraceae bacterium]|nr:hypothetical protein [Arcobacteraceae bacterium]